MLIQIAVIVGVILVVGAGVRRYLLRSHRRIDAGAVSESWVAQNRADRDGHL